MLCLEGEALPWDEAAAPLPDGHPLGEPAILFKKLDPTTLGEPQEG